MAEISVDRPLPGLFPSDRIGLRRLGSTRARDGCCEFSVWAPHATEVAVRLFDKPNRCLQLNQEPHGYHYGLLKDVGSEVRYRYVLDGGKERSDPASRFQPEGVYGPSQIDDGLAFQWHDREWRGLDLRDYIIYELHVGTYTQEGTFDGIVSHIPKLRSLGVTALELMPVAQFPGRRNWGYDGVFPFAAHNTYGGPDGLRRLVDACHGEGLAVILDVVYNHVGPEGNYLADFGPYFTSRYQTPWGEAINFDGPDSDEVVRYFIENALHWLDDFHIDALRLDAIHGIVDRNARPFLKLLSEAVDDFSERSGRRVYLIAESDLNDSRFVLPRTSGGYGLHAQWNDDFHHALHSLQTGEKFGYYCDFGSIEQLQKSIATGYVFTGQYSEFRKRRHGSPSNELLPSQFVVFSQNHDQVGNRMLGERSSVLLDFESLKLSAGVVLLSRNLPLLFMGEEYGEPAPFQYFTDHSDPGLGEAVRKGRKKEFAAFNAQGEPPDPQAESTFLSSKLDHSLADSGKNRSLFDFHAELIRLRKEMSALQQSTKFEVKACGPHECLSMHCENDTEELLAFFNFNKFRSRVTLPTSGKEWHKVLDSADGLWLGSGTEVPEKLGSGNQIELQLAARSFCLFRRCG